MTSILKFLGVCASILLLVTSAGIMYVAWIVKKIFINKWIVGMGIAAVAIYYISGPVNTYLEDSARDDALSRCYESGYQDVEKHGSEYFCLDKINRK